MSQHLPIFVYGTLQRGQSRERCWPHRPLSVEPATVRGRLYDLGPYPALVPGDDIVAGELWRLAAEDVPATLTALDKVEGFAGSSRDLYRRAIIDCQVSAAIVKAWTYLFVQTDQLSRATRIRPDDSGRCRWPGLGGAEP